MAGPASPSTEGPTYEPPQLPPGWIAQWDGTSKKYYFVSISTGVSQWDVPTQAAPGGTPAQAQEHPYGVPGQPEIITHPDGTQTVRYADGRMEPVMPPGQSTRGVGGESTDRGIGVSAAAPPPAINNMAALSRVMSNALIRFSLTTCRASRPTPS
jgi:hypothetical protein